MEPNGNVTHLSEKSWWSKTSDSESFHWMNYFSFSNREDSTNHSEESTSKSAMQIFGLVLMFTCFCFFLSCLWTEIKIINKVTCKSYREFNPLRPRSQLLFSNCRFFFLLKTLLHSADILPCFLGACSISSS